MQDTLRGVTLLVSIVAATAACAGDPGAPAVTELAPDVVVVTTEPFAANSLLVRGPGGIVLVDTPTTPADTAALLDWVRERWGAEPRWAINSHWHFDATGGNQVLIERGVQVISSPLTARQLREKGEGITRELVGMFAKDDPDTAAEIAATRPTPADRVVEIDGRAVLDLGGEEVWLVWPGPSHSADSIAVFFPARRVLDGGCAVRSDGRIGNRTEADFEHWPAAVEAMAALDPQFVVPGHGRRFDPAMLKESAEAARALQSARPAR